MTEEQQLVIFKLVIQGIGILAFIGVVLAPIIYINLPSTQSDMQYYDCISSTPTADCLRKVYATGYTQPQHEIYSDGTEDWIAYPIYAWNAPSH
jgi:hypothetical protein